MAGRAMGAMQLTWRPTGKQLLRQPLSSTLNQSQSHTGKPTSDGTDDQPNDECLYVHLSPRFLLARKGLVPSQLLFS
jgi:hypothetical protein